MFAFLVIFREPDTASCERTCTAFLPAPILIDSAANTVVEHFFGNVTPPFVTRLFVDRSGGFQRETEPLQHMPVTGL